MGSETRSIAPPSPNARSSPGHCQKAVAGPLRSALLYVFKDQALALSLVEKRDRYNRSLKQQ